MLCSTVLSSRNHNYVSDLRLFDEPLCRCVWTIAPFLDAGLIALCPNLFGLNTLNDVLKNGSSAFLNDSETIFPIFSPPG
jgi:hypothetical protein